jgi:hypothetical protein
MWRLILGLFLVAHGLVHAAMWLAPPPRGGDGVPFDPKHSWLLSSLVNDEAVRILSIVLATTAAIGFVGGGVGLLAHQGWWRLPVIGAAAVGLVLIGLYFHPWLSAGLGLEAAILLSLLWANWPSQDLAGA